MSEINLNVQLKEVSSRLIKSSVKNQYHVENVVSFPEFVEENQWFFSEELISLYGHESFLQLNELQKMRLSFFELINFFCINIHGEKSLLEGLSNRLYTNEIVEVDQYLHYFLDEENKHMYLFGNYCQKYAKKIYSDRKINFSREYTEGEEEFLFYIKVFVFEEIVDFYNVHLGKNEKIEITSRLINQNHHVDESRHLAFGRVMINSLFNKYKDEWDAETLTRIRNYIKNFYLMTWREYYNPDIYKDLGLLDPYKLSEEVFKSESASLFRKKVSKNSIQYLMKCGIILEEIDL